MCKLCKTKPVYEFTNKRKLCARCFVNYFERKILYTIRKFGMVKSGDVIGYFSSKHFRDIVLKEMLKIIADKGDVKIKELPPPNLKHPLAERYIKLGITKIALSSSVDLNSDEILDEIIKGNAKNLNTFLPVKKIRRISIISPLYLFLDEEILLYAKIKKLKFKKIKEKKDKIGIFLDEFEKKHPEVKRAIVNSLLALHQNNK